MWFLAFLLLPLSLFSIELNPWFGKPFELETRFTYLLQNFRSVDTTCCKQHFPSNNSFYQLGAELPVLQEYDLQLEVTAFNTRQHNFCFNDMSLTGRYKWMNDIVGDPVTLTTGITISKVFKPGRRDIASFHHGGIETELTVAAGQETSWRQFWVSRWWSVVGLGVADLGAPWVRADMAWENNWCDQHLMGIYMYTLWGFGNRRLSLERSFRGYGRIHHQSVDFGLSYEVLCGYARFRFEYVKRFYARNCPENVNVFMLRLLYPFGLGI